jgi:hypothetical protein
MRVSQRGVHQLALPSRNMVAGTTSRRMIVASTMMLTPSPRASILTTALLYGTKARNMRVMISAAQLITRARAASPPLTLAWLWCVRPPDPSVRMLAHRAPASANSPVSTHWLSGGLPPGQ